MSWGKLEVGVPKHLVCVKQHQQILKENHQILRVGLELLTHLPFIKSRQPETPRSRNDFANKYLPKNKPFLRSSPFVEKSPTSQPQPSKSPTFFVGFDSEALVELVGTIVKI